MAGVGKDVERGGSCALLVGVWIGAAAVGDGVEDLQRTRDRTVI